MLKIKCDINQQYLKTVDLHFEVVDRVSETQLKVGEHSDWIIWWLKGQPIYKQIQEGEMILFYVL